jgi:hypothetical protein
MHHALTLLWGVLLSAAFCGVRITKKNIGIIALIFTACGASQLVVLSLLGEDMVWKLYPVIVHALLTVLLCAVYRKRLITVLAAVSLAYLCCQPSKWFGLLAAAFTDSSTIIWCTRIAVALIVALWILCCFTKLIGEIFNKDSRSVLIFSSVPFAYYLFDYTVGIYTNLQERQYRLVSEFLSFFLCLVFIAFCVVYYREYEKKMQAQRKNEIIEIKTQQQANEIEAIKKSNLETSLLRHDMRLMLSNLALTIEQNDKEQARNLISGYVAQVDSVAVHRYCQNDTLNYILSNYESKCCHAGISFQADIALDSVDVDEILFASILSNALDNAVNAQKEMPEDARQIKVLLKNSDGKLLLSVKNPFHTAPNWDYVNQTPITTKAGHGYGTQSILYLTEKLGGKCQFSLLDNTFILRVIL